jgi:hypothetical protein
MKGLEMKNLFILIAVAGIFFVASPPSLCQSKSPADIAWAGYFSSLKSAVAKHDKAALKPLLASKIEVEDGKISDAQFIKGFAVPDDWTILANGLKTGKVSGRGIKRVVKFEFGEVGFIFAKGKWYLNAYSIGG